MDAAVAGWGPEEEGHGRPPPLLMINGHMDVAEACGADGVHLPESMLDHATELKGQGRSVVVGASVHSVVRFESGASDFGSVIWSTGGDERRK
jgi:hypothetical protein